MADRHITPVAPLKAELHSNADTPHRGVGIFFALLAALTLTAATVGLPRLVSQPIRDATTGKSLRLSLAPVLPSRVPKDLGELAYVNTKGVFIQAGIGPAHEIAKSASAATPLWSPSGQYLAYETAGLADQNPELHVYDVKSHRIIFSKKNVYTFSFQPHHDVLSFFSDNLHLLQLRADKAIPIAIIKGPLEENYIWSTNGKTLAYAFTQGLVGHRHDVVKEVTLTGTTLSSAKIAFTSPNNVGIWLAAFLPDSLNILYWTDGQYSASLMADSAPLDLWHQKNGAITAYPQMLPYRDYLTLPRPTQFAYMAGGPRTISGSKKYIVVVHDGVSRSLPRPLGKEVIEPTMNAKGDVAAVMARNDTNASWSLLKNYTAWLTSRKLAIYAHHHWTIWENAGTGVTDPVFLGHGLLYLSHHALWYIAGPSYSPTKVVGDIPSSGGYYGEILRSTLWTRRSPAHVGS